MHDDIRARSRRALVLFLGCVTLAFGMFATGLLIGRWARVPDARIGATRTASPAEPSRPREEVGAVSSGEPASYLIQAGSFASAADAERFVAHLKERGFDRAFVRSRSAPDGGSVAEVVLGPFEDAGAADRTLRELRNNGVSGARILPNR